MINIEVVLIIFETEEYVHYRNSQGWGVASDFTTEVVILQRSKWCFTMDFTCMMMQMLSIRIYRHTVKCINFILVTLCNKLYTQHATTQYYVCICVV